MSWFFKRAPGLKNSSLTELLCKDADNIDPGRVINISSTASVEAQSETALSSAGNGTWSCAYYLQFITVL